MNREHRVEFETVNGRYGLRSGNRPNNSYWQAAPPIVCWQVCTPGVHFSANVHSVQFNTNGTANAGTITVINLDMKKVFEVVVTRTGRIRVQRAS